MEPGLSEPLRPSRHFVSDPFAIPPFPAVPPRSRNPETPQNHLACESGWSGRCERTLAARVGMQGVPKTILTLEDLEKRKSRASRPEHSPPAWTRRAKRGHVSRHTRDARARTARRSGHPATRPGFQTPRDRSGHHSCPRRGRRRSRSPGGPPRVRPRGSRKSCLAVPASSPRRSVRSCARRSQQAVEDRLAVS